ncbi:MAG: metallophosphoesterase [Clostridia bacterium]|nr:metallophosphoesterase [Clostridia bacterium]
MNIRRLSWVLAAALLLSLLFGCGSTKPVPTPADCGVVEGMISHTSASNYMYADTEGVVSTQNALFVPAGTVISCEQAMAVYTYDEYNTLNTKLLASVGQNVIATYVVVMAPGTLTITEDAYIRLSVRGSLTDVSVTYPAERQAEVTVYDPVYEAYGKDYDRILPLINRAEGGAVNYIFLTDVHNDLSSNSDAQDASLKQQVEAAVKLANESNAIDFIVIGGDNTSGQYGDKATTLQYTHALFEPLKSCKKPVLMLMGNHDDNSYKYAIQPYNAAMAANLVSKVNWNKEILTTYSPATIVHDSQNANSAYYYYDLAEKKTRLICLDAIDYEQQTDENGDILVESLTKNAEGNTNVGRSCYGYSARQLRWLANEALTAAEGWNYIFFSHMNAQESQRYGTELRELIAAFQNRTTYVSDELGTVDFTAATGSVMLYQYGHVHVERITEDTALGLWRVATGSANIAQLTNNKKGSETYRAFGTDSESCFDILSVTKDKAVKYAFGAGSDVELLSPQK